MKFPFFFREIITKKLEKFEEEKRDGKIDVLNFYYCVSLIGEVNNQVSFMTKGIQDHSWSLNQYDINQRNYLFRLMNSNIAKILKGNPKPSYQESSKEKKKRIIKLWKKKVNELLLEVNRKFMPEIQRLINQDRKNIINPFLKENQITEMEIDNKEFIKYKIGRFKWMHQ